MRLERAATSDTGAMPTYDAERRLSHWQNAQSNPTTQARYLYDGSGQRVEQYVSGGSGAHTYYLPGGVEEVTPSGSLIKYYAAGGMTLGLNTAHDASGIAYLASDGLGSVSEALSPGGSATGAQLYSPYGGVRYSSGTMPTAKGFTGQYSDAASTGLDYYGARYYDPTLGQFTSADTANDELNRYGYVKGNPETATDPTGHMADDGANDEGGGGDDVPKGPPPSALNGGGGGEDNDGAAPPPPPPDILGYYYRMLRGGGGGPVVCPIPLGGGSSITIVLEVAGLTVYYTARDGTQFTFSATNTPMETDWLYVLEAHYPGGVVAGPAHPGLAGVPHFTSLDRARSLADTFHGTDPVRTRGAGYSTDVPAGTMGDVQIRCKDQSNNQAFAGDGPYLRFQRGTARNGREYLNFNGQVDDQFDHTHFYLGTAGEADDLDLQYAIAGTVLYQYANP